MAAYNEFAWTAVTPPPRGYVGYVKIKIGEDGVAFVVRTHGNSDAAGAAYFVPRDVAHTLLTNALAALDSV